MKKLRMVVGICLAVALLGGIGVYAASNYGSADDPLVTLSYLNQVLKPDLERKYNDATAQALAELEQQVTGITAGGYVAVTVTEAQVMTCRAGCEFLARSGAATVSDGVLDVTAGETVPADEHLQANHLYLTVGDTATVTAEGETLLMVRGDYTVN